MFKKIYSAGLAICLSSCSVIGINSTPQAKYQSIEKNNSFSIRVYDPVVEAQITVADKDYKSAVNKGFMQLFKYITGANTVNQKISMTAPVLTEQKSQNIAMTAPVLISGSDDNAWTIAFVMPADMTIKNAPKPTNENVKLVEKPQNKVAVIQFSGFLDKPKIESNTKKLKDWIKDNNLKVIGEPQAAGYNPPWTIPFLRTNEVMVAVK
ncbi:MAG: effector-binding domain-containing protein [Francisella sp.]